MKIEKLTEKSCAKCLNIAASQITSMRINDDVENTVRVYDNGTIGVEGRLGGNVDFADMEKAARAKLAQGIAYPETHDHAKTLEIDATKKILNEKDFIKISEKLLARLAKENPEFLFSNKLYLFNSESNYENSDGCRYSYKGNQFVCSLVIKYKGSANIMDENYGCESDYYDEEEICRDVKTKCDAFLRNIPQVTEDEVTVIMEDSPLNYALGHLSADLYFNKASIFDGKLGEKTFSDKLTVTINRSPDEQINLKFFDTEGVVNDGYKKPVIEKGVIKNLFTCKKSAAQYGVENLGAAGADYVDVPTASARGLTAENSAKSLAEIVKGKAVYVSVSGGGDMTPSGDVSIPVMVAYLYENGKLLGKLPEFTVSGNLFDMLGKDFAGTTDKGLFNFGRQRYYVLKAKLVNKSQS
ncbi:MAG: metallopeptidase TldD-related protein [Corallococcus sp.]|nr:metallopeptidase TldD-related protein [Corallococcus sp.]MCM1360145.1 metallopeptidase TldD-related protein [Corallococcus sp.]MCM1395467.1 metallopeptidase TldD-related protein [Corallococcus sp.]